MAEFPGFTIWTDAYLADTGHLSTLEHGAYLLLLIAMWRAGGALPNDDKRLARFARMNDAQWMKIRPTMMEFFKEVDGQIVQGRLQDELEKARNRSSRAAENARAKYRKTKERAPAGAVPEASHEPASISISIDTVKKEPSVPKKGTRIPDDFQPDLDLAVSMGLQPQQAISEAAKFVDYWRAKSGKDATKLDWVATWRNWIRSALDRQRTRGSPSQGRQSAFREHQDEVTRNLERQINGNRPDHDERQPAFDLELEKSAFYRDGEPAPRKR